MFDVPWFDGCPTDAAWFMVDYELSELFTCDGHLVVSGVSVEPPSDCLAYCGDVDLVFSCS